MSLISIEKTEKIENPRLSPFFGKPGINKKYKVNSLKGEVSLPSLR